MFPVMDPSASCLQLLKTGIPSFLGVALVVDDLAVATPPNLFSEAVAAALACGDPSEMVPLLMTGMGFLMGTVF